jgi:hypothetical protein
MANATTAMPLGTAAGAVLFALAHLFVQQPNAVALGYTAFTLAQVAPYVLWDYKTAAANTQNFTANAWTFGASPSVVVMSTTELVNKTATAGGLVDETVIVLTTERVKKRLDDLGYVTTIESEPVPFSATTHIINSVNEQDSNELYDMNECTPNDEKIGEPVGILRSVYAYSIDRIKDAKVTAVQTVYGHYNASKVHTTKYWTTSKVSEKPNAAPGKTHQHLINGIAILCLIYNFLFLGVITDFVIQVRWPHYHKECYVALLVILFAMPIAYTNQFMPLMRTLVEYVFGKGLWFWSWFKHLGKHPLSSLEALITPSLAQVYETCSCFWFWSTYQGNNLEDVLSWPLETCAYAGSRVGRVVSYLTDDHGILCAIADMWKSTEIIIVKYILAVLVALQELLTISKDFFVGIRSPAEFVCRAAWCSMLWPWLWRGPLIVFVTSFYIASCRTALQRWRTPLSRCIVVIVYTLASLASLRRTKCIQDTIVVIVISIVLYRQSSNRLRTAQMLFVFNEGWEGIGRTVTRGKAAVLGLYDHYANHVPHTTVMLHQGFLRNGSIDRTYHQDQWNRADQPPTPDVRDQRSSEGNDPAPSDPMPLSGVIEKNLQGSILSVSIIAEQKNESKAAPEKAQQRRRAEIGPKVELAAKNITIKSKRQQKFDTSHKVKESREAGSPIRSPLDGTIHLTVYDASCKNKHTEFNERAEKRRKEHTLHIGRRVNRSDKILQGAELEQQIVELTGISRESDLGLRAETQTPIRTESEVGTALTINNDGSGNSDNSYDKEKGEADTEHEITAFSASKKHKSEGSKQDLEQGNIVPTSALEFPSCDPSGNGTVSDGSNGKTHDAKDDSSKPFGEAAVNLMTSTFIPTATLPAATSRGINNEDEDTMMSDAEEPTEA